MTLDEYYNILKTMYQKVDWNDLNSIKRYNQFKEDLRKELEDSNCDQPNIPYEIISVLVCFLAAKQKLFLS